MKKPNDRVIRVIVAVGSLVLLIAIGYPLVDEGQGLRADLQAFTELEQEFESTKNRNRRLTRIEETLQIQKDDLTHQNVTPELIADVRDEIIKIVRENNGSLRSLEIQEGQSRIWATEGDDPHQRDRPEMGMESEFELHSHSLSLSVSGSLKAALAITRTMSDHHWLMSIETMDLKPGGNSSNLVSLEMNITLFGLKLAPEPVEETFASLN